MQTQIDQTTDAAIYSWIEANPDHADDYNFDFVHDDTALVINKILAKPDKLIDYEDVESFSMIGPKVGNGCNYLFKRGPYYKSPCKRQTVEGTDKCNFHNHPIFNLEVANAFEAPVTKVTEDRTFFIPRSIVTQGLTFFIPAEKSLETEIYEWFKSHPDHIRDYDDIDLNHDSIQEVVREFLAEPEGICDYEN